MRMIIQALVGSAVVHAIYFAFELAIGLVQTYFYQPDVEPNMVVLQNEITFGYVVNFPYVGMSFILVALVIGVVVMIRDRKTRLGH